MAGQKMSLSKTISMIMSGLVIMALKWDYQSGKWVYVSPVEISRDNINIYCKYSEAGIALKNLIDMRSFEVLHLQPLVPLVRKRVVTI